MKLQYEKVATMCTAGRTAKQISTAFAVEVYQLYNWRSRLPIEQRANIKFGKSAVRRGPKLGPRKKPKPVITWQPVLLLLPVGKHQTLYTLPRTNMRQP